MIKEGDPLTPRELDVAALIGNGYPDEKIARILCISELTVRRHGDNIRRKPGFRTRSQIAVWAFQQGLG